ncbi:hypothetical protein cyc_08126 [Cyclospora cayetanensis]|uniref:Uncharacterized protein n=1 Tax=Cyclospora cayetanensis TaxID=88456 RepID=A0A1D3D3M1_9EIME|nr:hypothetical protein cyc_08126 [Cyclospora cayetanensis]
MKSVVLLLILSVFSVHRYSCLSHLLEAFSVLAFAAAEGSGPSLQELADAAPSPSHIGTASAFTSSLLKEIELGTTVGREAEKQVASAAAKDSGEKEGLLSACAAFSSTEPELWRICLVAANHISALYRRLTVENTLVRRLSPSEFSAAIAEHLQVILEEEDNIAQSVVDGLLPHGALPVFSLKVAIQRKLQSLGLLKPKNITTQPGLLGLEVIDGKLQHIEKSIRAQVAFFYDLMAPKFRLSPMSDDEVRELAAGVADAFAHSVLSEEDLPIVLEFMARAVLDTVAAPGRSESLRTALQAMPPFAPVGSDNGLAPLALPLCLKLVRGLFPSLRAHMTLHYQMKGPTEQEMQEMAAVLWPLVNAHRSRLRLSAHKGVTLLAPEEHSLLWAYMEIYAREHHLVGPERPLNLWRFPEPAGAASLLE